MHRKVIILGLSFALIFLSFSVGAAKDPEAGRAGCGKAHLKMEPAIVGMVCKPAYIVANTPAVILISNSDSEDHDWKGNLGKKVAVDLVYRGVISFRFDMPGKGDSSKLGAGQNINDVMAKAVEQAGQWLKDHLGIPPNHVFISSYGEGVKFMGPAASLLKKNGKHFKGWIIVEAPFGVASQSGLSSVNGFVMLARGTRSDAISEPELIKLQNMLGTKKAWVRLTTIDEMDHGLKLKNSDLSYTLTLSMSEWMSELAKR
ncbi:MAG TPA: hypothetical protein VJL87_07800 [Bdellovibrionota bacterium]|nr:hypothetical protein [Bdellovibrionota bacterium]